MPDYGHDIEFGYVLDPDAGDPHGVLETARLAADADEFIEASREGMAHGVSILHFLGGPTIDLNGDRAVSETKMTIAQRAEVDGVLCDVVCTGRFVDFWERREGRWGLVVRQPIYERDRIDPVEPGARVELDQVLLSRLPEGYRHLGYLQTRIGYQVKDDMPGLIGPATDALYRSGAAWPAGSRIPSSATTTA